MSVRVFQFKSKDFPDVHQGTWLTSVMRISIFLSLHICNTVIQWQNCSYLARPYYSECFGEYSLYTWKASKHVCTLFSVLSFEYCVFCRNTTKKKRLATVKQNFICYHLSHQTVFQKAIWHQACWSSSIWQMPISCLCFNFIVTCLPLLDLVSAEVKKKLKETQNSKEDVNLCHIHVQKS